MSIDLKALCAAWDAAQTTVGDDYGVTPADAMKLARAVANVILDELESKNEEVEIDSEEGGYVGRAVCLRHFGLLRMEINHNG